VNASIPLILAIHGGGDDALQFVDETGLLPIAEKERIAIVAPNNSVFAVDNIAMPALVRYMLTTYPALDASRVYVTGYSTGGMGTCAATYGAPELFAASVPMAAGSPPSGKYDPTEEQLANIAKYDMPIMIMCSTYEGFFDRKVGGLDARYQTYLTTFLSHNHMDPITFDFAAYPMCGFKANSYTRTLLNGEYFANKWVLNKGGIPMVSLNITEGLPHGLYQEYGVLGWNFMKHYARSPKTGELLYNPNGF
jgi:pimeloyl-ACP methyl ester carboxylesterase